MRKIKHVARLLPDLAKSMELKAFCRLAELAREKKEELSRKRNIKCGLCEATIKTGEVQICYDCHEGEIRCKEYVKECISCSEVTRCQDCLMVEDGKFKSEDYEWECMDCWKHSRYMYESQQDGSEY